jgi:putative DNA primase/helicase
MIDGCLDWQKCGLAAPETLTSRSPAWEKSLDLYASWVAWAKGTGEYEGTQKRFSQNLETRGFTYERRMNARGFRGLRLAKSWGAP